MLLAGYAQEIITPPVGVGLAGYFNRRPNTGMYDDLMVKVVVMELDGRRFGFMLFDLCYVFSALYEAIRPRIEAEFGPELYAGLIISATHTHTGPDFKKPPFDERTGYALNQTADAAIRALRRAVMNLQPAELAAGEVYNNPYGFVRRYRMKDGSIVTNPGWRNPDIDGPESNFDRTVSVAALRQGGRIAALMCNIANHGDTVGGDLVSADWHGQMALAIQHALGERIPVLVFDDASGNINHFDFNQQINQTSIRETRRIGRGYAAIALDLLDRLEPVAASQVLINNTEVDLPHRKITPEELAEARRLLATLPDSDRDGDFESQALARGEPAALRYFAQRTVDCHAQSRPSHRCRLTAIELGTDLVFATLPGEPFNGIGAAVRAASPGRHTFIIELAQSVSGYIPMPECFRNGGYEVQPAVDSAAPETADLLIAAAIANLGRRG